MTDILMPQMGLSVTEGTITKWRVAVGDRVVAEEAVCEITTDKTDAEVMAPSDGVVTEILAIEGDVVPIGAPIGRMSGEETIAAQNAATSMASDAAPGSLAAATESAAEMVPEATVAPSAVESPSAASVSRAATSTNTVTEWRSRRPVAEMLSGAVIDAAAAASALLDHLPTRSQPAASPMARRRAKALGVDLAVVRGSGRNGRVCIQDVISATRSLSPAPVAGKAPSPSGPLTLPLGYEDVPHEIVATSPHRRAISEHMIRSRMTAAHMTTEVDVNMTKVSQIRQLVNAAREGGEMSRVSFLSFIAKVASSTLRGFPDLNATFQHDRSIRWLPVNLGIAVDTPSGLVVPVLRSADQLNVTQLADGIAMLAERARARKLVPDDIASGTFTISNPGSVGAVSAPAIINQPQVAILGVPTIQRRPWVVTTAEGVEGISILPILRLALTFDHRAVDGADATRFLVEVRDRLETWEIGAYT